MKKETTHIAIKVEKWNEIDKLIAEIPVKHAYKLVTKISENITTINIEDTPTKTPEIVDG